MIALIDGDIVAFRCAVSVTEDEPEELAIYRVDVLIQQIIEATEADSYRVFVKGDNNFRYKIYPEYKANRKEFIDPVHRAVCHNHLLLEHNAIPAEFGEADDMLGIYQEGNTVICSIDKDLLMIPGRHYNFVKVEHSRVKPQDGLRTFYKQMMIGDRSDNLIGVEGIGPKKADKLIDPLDDEQDMFDVVYDKYKEDAKRFVTNANCFWILQRPGGIWAKRQNLILPNQCQQEVDQQLEFISSMKECTSTEHTTHQKKTSGIQSNGAGMESTPIDPPL
jgi:DNA polymerase-1